MGSDLESRAAAYVGYWWASEDAMTYRIGCPDYGDRKALIFIVEAARSLCGVEHEGALALLRLAVAELESRVRS